jgi:hypothetical protein
VRALRRRGIALPAAFDAWFFRATAVDPEQRFERASAAAAALAQALDVPPVSRAGGVGPAVVPLVEARTPVAPDEGRPPATPPGLEQGATGKGWGTTVAEPRTRRRAGLLLAGGVAALAVAAGAWFFVLRPPLPADSASAVVPSAGTTAPPSPEPALTTPGPKVEPRPEPTSTSSAKVAAPSASSAGKRRGGKPAGSTAPVGSGAPAASTSTTTSPPAAPTKPGMF